MAIKNTTDQKLNDNVLLTSKYSQRCVILWYQYSCASYPKSPSKNHCVIIICLRFNYTINLIRPELNCLFHGSLKVVFLFSLGRPQKHSWGDINHGCLDYVYESINKIWEFSLEWVSNVLLVFTVIPLPIWYLAPLNPIPPGLTRSRGRVSWGCGPLRWGLASSPGGSAWRPRWAGAGPWWCSPSPRSPRWRGSPASRWWRPTRAGSRHDVALVSPEALRWSRWVQFVWSNAGCRGCQVWIWLPPLHPCRQLLHWTLPRHFPAPQRQLHSPQPGEWPRGVGEHHWHGHWGRTQSPHSPTKKMQIIPGN